VRILGDSVVEMFGSLFDNPQRDIKTKVGALLCTLNSKHANRILFDALRGKKQDGAVSEVFVSIGVPAIQPLIAALRDSDFVVRGNAENALSKIGGPAVPSLISALREMYLVAQHLERIAVENKDKPEHEIWGDVVKKIQDWKRKIRYHIFEGRKS